MTLIGGESDPSEEVQSVYSTTPAEWARLSPALQPQENTYLIDLREERYGFDLWFEF